MPFLLHTAATLQLGLQAPSRTAVVTHAQKGARKAARTKRSTKPASDAVQL